MGTRRRGRRMRNQPKKLQLKEMPKLKKQNPRTVLKLSKEAVRARRKPREMQRRKKKAKKGRRRWTTRKERKGQAQRLRPQCKKLFRKSRMKKNELDESTKKR